MKRADAEQLVKKNGGSTKSSVTKDLTYLVTNDKETLDMICKGNITDIEYFKKVNKIILATKPITFDDLIKIDALIHGTDVWENNAECLIKDGTAPLNEVIACRDDIMNYLISKGVEDKTAFDIMESVRKGNIRRNREEKWKEYKEVMRNHNVPNWYISSCEKISYLFPKAHSVGYMINYFRLTWYKFHYSQEFDEVIKGAMI